VFFLMQVWCILLSDKVPFKMHCPLHSDMQDNGIWIGLFMYSESYFDRFLVQTYLVKNL
jgi:hypothetical protein